MKKSNKIIYWISTIWLALGMLSTGLVQLLKVKTGAGGLDSVTHLGYPAYVVTILGVCKVLGIIAVLVPKFTLIKEWAYAGFFFMMTGAAISHLVSNSMNAIFPSLLLLSLTIISWYFRPADRKITSVN